MGFSNPAQPVDYDLIGQLVSQGIDYNAVRSACDQALASTDNAIATLSTAVASKASSSALGAVATDVDQVLTDLAAANTALSSVSAILSEVQTRPDVSGWSNPRKTALTQLLAVGVALDQVNAQLARVPDASPQAAAVVAALEAEATSLWSDVK